MANVIEKYKATHRRIRRVLNPYTARLCPECAEPCCRKPTKVREFDVLLANACGRSLSWTDNAISEYVDAGLEIMSGNHQEHELEPCDYLGPTGCVFPDDLRPYECTKWMCSFLKNEVTPNDMRELRDLLHKLGALHRELQDASGMKRK